MTAALRRRRVRAVAIAATGAASLLLAACHGGDASGLPLRVEISHRVGTQPLQLGETEYTLDDGDALRIDRLRYYLSNFRLRRHDRSWSAAARSDSDARGYVLVDEAQPASRSFEVAGFAPGEYEGVEFLIGVDAARNSAGAQTGALDPALGMFWTWNSGYIFLKLEGRSPQATTPGQRVSWHVGGSPNARTVYLPLPRPLRLAPDIVSTVHLHADVAAALLAGEPLRVAGHEALMDPAGGAAIADRYATAFRVDHVHHEPRR
ncbi:MbnP family protein [Solimonas soli]|uniref:MbnP family protein n=1 Tax=Solimonas soli TaxID=413479 RepID=UPI0012FA7B0A|nr:MbnP family protein [Solimonas soli]